jgi:hypothetical protein
LKYGNHISIYNRAMTDWPCDSFRSQAFQK